MIRPLRVTNNANPGICCLPISARTDRVTSSAWPWAAASGADKSRPRVSVANGEYFKYGPRRAHLLVAHLLVLMDLAGCWDTRIGPWAAAVLAEEPGQIRAAVLFVTAKIVDAGPAEIAKEQCAAIITAV